jgi:hypothetical protein
VYRWYIVVLAVALAVSANAQMPLSPSEAVDVNRVLDREPLGERLNCRIERRDPSLDFEFRFIAGFTVQCPLKAFEGRVGSLNMFVRVTPESGPPVVLGGTRKLAGVPAEMANFANPRKLSTLLEASGAFAVGEGHYRVEVLAVDDRRRTCRKEWQINVVRRHAVGNSPAILKVNTVAPADFVPWDGRSKAAGESVRVTVLLDVAPINPREARLRAWDRSFLLHSFSSLLRAMPCQSVRLVAFNLDQDREIYRNSQFRGGEEFDALNEAMQELELGTVSYHVLQQQQGWVKMLWNLANTELRAEDPVDAVIILGPATRTQMKIEKAKLQPRETANPRFFYFEYSNLLGDPFPDSMGTLSKALGGTAFVFHSPQELAQDIRKMLTKLKPGISPEATATRWPGHAAPEQ